MRGPTKDHRVDVRFIDIFGYPDDVQKFEKAIVSGKPFQTESTRRRVVKGNSTNADDANDDSDPGSESTSDHEPPKVVSNNSVLTSSHSDLVRIMHGGVLWHSSRTRARTVTDSCCVPYPIPCLLKFVAVLLVISHHQVGSKYLKAI